MRFVPKFYTAPAGIGRGKRQKDPAVGTPHPVDVHVGSRLRLRRTMLGMSQEKLGSAVGLTFQQIQKYERGANRMGSSRLYQFSRLLEVSISYFFDDMPDDAVESVPNAPTSGMSDRAQADVERDPMARQETLELVRAYYRIQDPKVRERLYDLVRAMANLPDEE